MASPELVSIRSVLAVSIVPMNLSNPFTLPILLWVDFTAPCRVPRFIFPVDRAPRICDFKKAFYNNT